MWTLTVAEYQEAPLWKRLFYRTFRNPFVLLGIGPALLFLVDNRWPWSGKSRRERFSVHFTNAGNRGRARPAHLTIGLPIFLATQVPTQLLAGAIGIWLFYIQHQFEDVYWARRPAWEPVKAALEGSSYYKLPRVLQWLTGSIGLHHIHHVQPRIPFYNLQSCQDAIPAFQHLPALTSAGASSSSFCASWTRTDGAWSRGQAWRRNGPSSRRRVPAWRLVDPAQRPPSARLAHLGRPRYLSSHSTVSRFDVPGLLSCESWILASGFRLFFMTPM